MRRLLTCLLLLSAGLAACAPAAAPRGDLFVAHAAEQTPTPGAPRTAVPTWTLPFLPSPTPTPSPSASPTAVHLQPPETLFTPTPTPSPCLDTSGTVVTASVTSDTLNYPIDTRLYLPPCYARSADRYPVLYLIHGLSFKEDQWDRLGAPAAADALIAAGEIAPLIIVMPRDRLDPRLDPALVQDLVPYVDANYRTLAAREFRAIGGLSRGAGWAIHLGLHYPETFGRMGAHSPVVFYGDENSVLEWVRNLPDGQAPAIYFDIGENDGQRQSAVWLDQVLTWFEIGHTYLLQPGSHSEAYWSAHVAEYLRFYAADWRSAFTPTPSPYSQD